MTNPERGATRRWVTATATAVALAASVTGLAGCGGDGHRAAAAASRPPERPGPGTHALTMTWDKQQRQYAVEAPAGYRPDRPTPLVVVLHGMYGSGYGMHNQTELYKLAGEKGFLLAYPDGLDATWSPIPNSEPDDPGFIRAMVKHLIEKWHVAPGQVYATGFSRGAAMTYRLAVEANDVFAAIAPVSGAFEGIADAIRTPSPVSIAAFLGTADTGTYESGRHGLELWRTRQGCQAGEPTWVDPGRTVGRTEAHCGNGSEIVEYRIAELPHAWPSSLAYAIDANETMWEFFAAHARR